VILGGVLDGRVASQSCDAEEPSSRRCSRPSPSSRRPCGGSGHAPSRKGVKPGRGHGQPQMAGEGHSRRRHGDIAASQGSCNRLFRNLWRKKIPPEGLSGREKVGYLWRGLEDWMTVRGLSPPGKISLMMRTLVMGGNRPGEC